jgi:peptide/nickel transport system substrate-binding protein
MDTNYSLHKFIVNAHGNVFWGIIVFHIFLLLPGCGNVENHSDKMVFKYNEDVSVTTLDPAFVKSQSEIWIVSQLFEGLVSLDNELHTKSCIAKSWEISNQGKTYTFHLRDDVVFHNSPLINGGKARKLCAQDFEYSFYRLINPSTASPGSWVFNDKINAPQDFNNIAQDTTRCFRTIDDSTFQINLTKPFPPLLSLLSMPYCFAVPKELAEEDNFRLNPLGTGPFSFKLWEENVKLILLKNDNYYESQFPKLDAINIDFIQNKQLAFMNFVQGKYSFFNGLEGSYKDEVLQANGELQEKYKDKFSLEKEPFLNTEYIGFILDAKGNENLNKKRVRQALNYGIQREKMINNLRNGIGTPANGGFIPKGLPGNICGKGYRYDLKKAKELLAGANIDGNEIIEINTTQDYLDMCLFIQTDWNKLGIKSKITVHPAGFLRQLRNKREIKVFRGSWIADYSDAENYLSCFYSPNFSPAGPNYCHFKNTQFDSLYEKALQATEEEEKLSLYRQMDSILVEEAPILFLYYDYSIRLVQKNVKGLKNTPANQLLLKNVEIH